MQSKSMPIKKMKKKVLKVKKSRGRRGKTHLTNEQMQQQNVKLAQVALGAVNQVQTFPAKLVVNTDRQAHVSPSFAGRVESVYVELGQQVKRGQALANLLVPDLVDQQANLQIAQTNLDLAKQDYERERSLWSGNFCKTRLSACL
jgi:cobalt-zinc-cadmium efflux system membrane fusion protein